MKQGAKFEGTFPHLSLLWSVKFLPDDVLVAARVKYDEIKIFCCIYGHLGHKNSSYPELHVQRLHVIGNVAGNEMIFESWPTAL